MSDLPRYPPEANPGVPVRPGGSAPGVLFWGGLLVLVGALVGVVWLLGPALFLLFLVHPIILPVLLLFAVAGSGAVVLIAALSLGHRDRAD